MRMRRARCSTRREADQRRGARDALMTGASESIQARTRSAMWLRWRHVCLGHERRRGRACDRCTQEDEGVEVGAREGRLRGCQLVGEGLLSDRDGRRGQRRSRLGARPAFGCTATNALSADVEGQLEVSRGWSGRCGSPRGWSRAWVRPARAGRARDCPQHARRRRGAPGGPRRRPASVPCCSAGRVPRVDRAEVEPGARHGAAVHEVLQHEVPFPCWYQAQNYRVIAGLGPVFPQGSQ